LHFSIGIMMIILFGRHQAMDVELSVTTTDLLKL